MAQIDYFLSTISPWTYLAGLRVEALAAQHGATIVYKPFDVVAIFPRTGGVAPAQRHENRKAYRLQELRRWSQVLGMPLNPAPKHWPTNAAPSAYAIIAAQAAGGGDLGGLVHATLRACWAEDRDVADDAVIRDLLAAHGFDPALADRGMLAGAETYARNLDEAVARGVFGAPFFIVGDERFWGQDRIEHLGLHLAGRL